MFDHHLGLGPVEGLQLGPEGAMQVVVVLSAVLHSTQPRVPSITSMEQWAAESGKSSRGDPRARWEPWRPNDAHLFRKFESRVLGHAHQKYGLTGISAPRGAAGVRRLGRGDLPAPADCGRPAPRGYQMLRRSPCNFVPIVGGSELEE